MAWEGVSRGEAHILAHLDAYVYVM